MALPSATGSADSVDLVGIGAEVDAFAYLITSKQLSPPLAIGLFGGWGSGKSYFVRSLQRRVDRLLTDGASLSPDQLLPFHRSVVQIEFNAWQYMGGDLWASLLDHIIRNLAPAADADDLVDAARRRYLSEIREADDESADLLRQREDLEDERRKAKAEMARREAQLAQAVALLEHQRREHPVRALAATPELRERVQKIANKAGIGVIVSQADDLREQLASSRIAARQAGGITDAIRRGGWVHTVVVMTIIAGVPALVWTLAERHVTAVTQASAAVASVVAAAVGLLKTGHRTTLALLEEIDAAETQLRAAEHEQSATLDSAVKEAEMLLQRADEALALAQRQQASLTNRVDELQAKLAAVTPARVLDDFLRDRLGSDDYRDYLGLPAIVRRDLERLSNIIEDENRQTGRPADDGTRINRVVLYIDDLDRCPTRIVLQVLQAVHLLLAFPLFVVVVAVDSRWVANSLKAHYRAQLQDGVTADDYLEKIFQVPFWVPPLGDDLRRRMVRGLLARNLGLGAATYEQEAAEDDPGLAGQDLDTLVQAIYDSGSEPPRWVEAATLTVSQEELAFVEEVSPLLGATPRSVKRFVNIFQLVKAIADSRGAVTTDDLQRLIFLLAVATGPPETARDLFVALDDADPSTPLGLLAGSARLETWLAQRPVWSALPVSALAPWVEPVRRFSFHAGYAARDDNEMRAPRIDRSPRTDASL